MLNNHISRKQFLKNLGIFSLGAGLFSPIMKIKSLANSPMLLSPDGDYKVLVCFFQGGGNDSFNMLIPRGSEHNLYAQTRTGLAIDEDDLLPIYPTNTGGRTFGLHPSMPEIQQLFNNEKIAFISNLGTLIQPTTAEQVINESVPLPLGLFSHSDQQQEWMTGTPDTRAIKGWGGKIADSINSLNPSDSISMNISLSGTNIFQNGNNTIEFSISPYDDEDGIIGYGEDSWDRVSQAMTNGLDSLWYHNYEDPFKNTYIGTIREAKEAFDIYKHAIDNTEDLSTNFSDNDASRALGKVAKIIKANNILGFKRQIYFVEYGGWDHHDELLDSQSRMLREVSRGFGEFFEAMKEINMEDNVTVFSMSEFGRTLTSNGNGTDHAWGGNVMVMGGAVNGKRIFGEYPTLNLDNELMLWNGVVVPTLSTDEYFTELAQWFGYDNDLIPSLFPNIGNFYDINSGNKPISFLNY